MTSSRPGCPATAQSQDNEDGPSVSELAEKIKALKAAHSIEATPQRVRQKHSTAEEPVTARIRRRTEANPLSGQAVETNGELRGGETLLPEPSALQPPPAAGEDSSVGHPMTFQERIAMERQRKDQEPRLS